jgi:lipopolysaccharide biosynthesis glycosyltransferase
MLNIVCACDTNFIAHLATMLLSLVENNERHSIRIFVLCDCLLRGHEKLVTMLRGHPAELSFISVVEGLLRTASVYGHISKAAYARLLMGQLLPPDIDRVLYLDCDLIVRGDLGDLWNTDLDGKTIGAVSDSLSYSRHSILGLPQGAPYFNSGVMLIDLRRWREMDVGGRSLKFAREHPDRLQWWDQCALNLILHDDWLPLDRKWNFQSMAIGVRDSDIIRFSRLTPGIRDAIQVVHFSGDSKPWHYMNYHPLKGEYLEYRLRTPWPLEYFDDRYPHNIMIRFLHRYLPPLLPLYLAARKII